MPVAFTEQNYAEDYLKHVTYQKLFYASVVNTQNALSWDLNTQK